MMIICMAASGHHPKERLKRGDKDSRLDNDSLKFEAVVVVLCFLVVFSCFFSFSVVEIFVCVKWDRLPSIFLVCAILCPPFGVFKVEPVFGGSSKLSAQPRVN